MKRLLSVGLAAMCLVFFGSSDNAIASDSHLQGGAVCMAVNGDRQDDLNYDYGYAYNETTSDIGLNCPIMRDSVTADLNSLKVTGMTRYKNGSNTCKIRIRSYWGLGGYGEDRTNKATKDYYYWRMTFSDSGMGDYDYHYYYIYCSLAPKSELYSIYWNES